MNAPRRRFMGPLGRLQNKIDRVARNRRYQKALRGAPVLEGASSGPSFSIVLPVCDPPLRFLQEAVSSVLSQTYRDLDLCICDDGSASSEVKDFLERLKAQHPPFEISRHPSRQGIARASNSALALAKGDWVLFLDHDDELAAGAAGHLAEWLSRHPRAEVVYSDEDKIDERGRHFNPFFKPDYSPHLLLGCNYVGHLLAVRRDCLAKVGGFRPGFEGAQDYDLLLRLSRVVERFEHLPQVLYHWREWEGSTARDVMSKAEVGAGTRKALAEHLSALGYVGMKPRETGYPDRVRWQRPRPSNDTTVLWLHGGEAPGQAWAGGPRRREPLDDETHSRVSLDHYLDASFLRPIVGKARESTAELILYTNGAIVPPDEKELTQLLALALEPRMGVAGGLLSDRRGRVCDAGANLSREATLHFPFAGLREGNPGYQGLALVESNVLAPCVHCFAAKRDLFLELYQEGLSYLELCRSIIAREHFNVCRPTARAGARGAISPVSAGLEPMKIAVTENDPIYLCDV